MFSSRLHLDVSPVPHTHRRDGVHEFGTSEETRLYSVGKRNTSRLKTLLRIADEICVARPDAKFPVSTLPYSSLLSNLVLVSSSSSAFANLYSLPLCFSLSTAGSASLLSLFGHLPVLSLLPFLFPSFLLSSRFYDMCARLLLRARTRRTQSCLAVALAGTKTDRAVSIAPVSIRFRRVQAQTKGSDQPRAGSIVNVVEIPRRGVHPSEVNANSDT